jgi:hypothetical protein
MTRRCGNCQLCCTLLPVRELGKPAVTRCQHQRWGKGCAIYAERPLPCKMWQCMWLADPEATRDMRRPDRAHYVVDIMPDFVERSLIDGRRVKDEVVQVWCDPRHPDAHNDPALRAYLEHRGLPALVRYGSKRGRIIVPPQLSATRAWMEIDSTMSGPEHSAADIHAVIGTAHDLRRGLATAEAGP